MMMHFYQGKEEGKRERGEGKGGGGEGEGEEKEGAKSSRQLWNVILCLCQSMHGNK